MSSFGINESRITNFVGVTKGPKFNVTCGTVLLECYDIVGAKSEDRMHNITDSQYF